MIRSCYGWLRVVLPPWWALALFVVTYMIFAAFYGFVWWQIGEALSEMLPTHTALVVLGAGLYSAYRAVAFHLVFRPNYRQWLERTPWTSAKPLPLGPIHFVLQDVVVLAVAFLLLHDTQIHPLRVPLAILLPHIVILTMSFFVTGVRWVSYIQIFGLGLAVWLAVWPLATLSVVALLYGLSCIGIRRSMASFPWNVPIWMDPAFLGTGKRKQEVRSGWPFELLSPKRREVPITGLDKTLISLLAGWWLYAIESVCPQQQDAALFGETLLAGIWVGAPAIRLFLYCLNHRSPINFVGRVCTFRWIIPGYDKVFLAPLCGLAVGIVVPAVLGVFGLAENVIHAVSVTSVLMVVFHVGPSLREWRLTGNHRIVPDFFNKQEYLRL